MKWWHQFAKWPPNVFGLTSLLLETSGAYRKIVSPTTGWPPSKNWEKDTARIASRWATWATTDNDIPKSIAKRINTIASILNVKISSIDSDDNACKTILEMHALADEACVGVGIPVSTKETNLDQVFLFRANSKLSTRGTLSDIDPSIVRVLPKLRTPQTGITLRSLSQHLTAHVTEVDVFWDFHDLQIANDTRQLNLLIIPWPKVIDPKSFKEASGTLANLDLDRFGFFSYQPEAPFDHASVVAIIQEANRTTGKVHGVIFPECAVPAQELDTLQNELSKCDVSMLIAGAYTDRKNFAHLGLATTKGDHEQDWVTFAQNKHHRWCIDRRQIRQYSLGSALHPSRKWWEHIDIPRRELRFVTANSWLTMCHLICEDLARQDPVAPLIRGVGPSLIVALLMDGPQLQQRWSGRYATVLADDPGSSVLSVTSLGMCQRSRPPGTSPSRTIGLWKDQSGGAEELALDHNADAVLLSLCANWVEEWSADGRRDGGATAELVLTAVEQVRVRPPTTH